MDSMIYTPDRLTAPKVSSRFSRRPRFVVCAQRLDCRVGGSVFPSQRHLNPELLSLHINCTAKSAIKYGITASVMLNLPLHLLLCSTKTLSVKRVLPVAANQFEE